MGPRSRTAIARYWATDIGRRRLPRLLVDVGEPACFACDYFSEYWHCKPGREWDTVPLERAHIIARSAGGSNEVDNFVLLFPDCHAAAPMTTDPAVMLSWMTQRRPYVLRKRD